MTNEELVNLIQRGEDVAGNMWELYRNNTGLMFKAAQKFKGYAEFDDLMQEAFFGLANAANHYDPDKGAFSTYAYYHIYNAMSRYAKQNNSVTMSEYVKDLVGDYKHIVAAYSVQGQNEPSLERMAYLLGCTKKTAKKVSEIAHRGISVSLDTPLGEDISLGDTVTGCEGIEEGIIDGMLYDQMKHELWQKVDDLGEKPAHLLREHYQKGATLRKLAECEGVTVERIRTIERDALKKLIVKIRHTAVMEYVEDFIYSHALRENGLRNFNRTFTSSTEKTALALYENDIY